MSRTGYTGDLGYEIWVDAPDAVTVWDAVWDAAEGYGMLPYGMGALYMLRIEAGLLLLGADFDSSRFAFNDAHRSTPLELGWAWMFKGLEEDDRPFIGRRALERERAEKSVTVADGGAGRRLAGLRPRLQRGRPDSARRTTGPSTRTGWCTTRIGHASATRPASCTRRCCSSTSRLARVRPDLAKPGTRVFLEFTVDHHYEQVAAHVARLPLYNPERKTA